MRRPLKYQIMVPMLCLMLSTILLFSVVDAWLAGRRARLRIEKQLRDIATTLAASSFPLTDRVLAQMQGLSGGEFFVTTAGGDLIASSRQFRSLSQLVGQAPLSTEDIALDERVQLNSLTYFHVPVKLNRPTPANGDVILHCLYPLSQYQDAWRQAALPPITLGTISMLLVVGISSMVSLRVTRPIQKLSRHVERIAQGDFAPMEVPKQRDELQDLALAANRMAQMLAEYEERVRRNERLQTLDQLGGGIAHQLRNNVTGCRMALDLHQRRCSTGNDMSLTVAMDQLQTMETYLRKFLSLGRQNIQETARLNVLEVIDDVVPLVRVRSEHLGVRLDWTRTSEPLWTRGDAGALAQAVANLLLNAVDAAAAQAAKPNAGGSHCVRIVAMRRGDQVRIEVLDSGEGPAQNIQQNLFEPLVSAKRDGVGLGLAIVRDIVEAHGGHVGWHRRDGMTCFFVDLPICDVEPANAQLTCR